MSNDFERYANKLRQIDPAVKAAQPTAARVGAKIVRREVEATAPVQDGDLKRSIGDKPLGRDGDAVRHQAHVGIFYAHYVEYGHGADKTGRRGPAAPHPFFRPAVDRTEADALKAIVDELWKAAEAAVR
jgi:HK97 gp10 family phage protein